MKGPQKKVFVGMSGGVDSSVSAALLKEQGYDVTGVFIKVWQPDFLPCNWKEERLDAMRVCAHLGIPFLFLDLEKEYKSEVIDYMIEEYKKGRTPNPDVMCNKYVKFGGFYDFAMAQGANFVATGHYARVLRMESGMLKGKDGDTDSPSTSHFQLLTGRDAAKDQSYFLWTIPQEKLKKVLFPVGDIEKPEVRELARKFGLPTAEKKDSQGLCFVGKVDMQEFLSHFMKPEEGKVLDESGETIGTHPGALFFTIGQRHGFTIEKKTPDDFPYYVVSKDTEKNTLTVASRAERSEESYCKEVLLENENWISTSPIGMSGLRARGRYRQKLFACKLSTTVKGTVVTFDEKQATLTPGQSIVVYRGEECLGGGIIASLGTK